MATARTKKKTDAPVVTKQQAEDRTTSLANSYRPKRIGAVVGQRDTVKKLKGMLTDAIAGRGFPNTILLTGNSGCGKTTLARIIARTLNCSNIDKETLEPCGECINCKYSASGHPDVLELNMAVDRGIGDIRSVTQAAKNSPTMGRFRIIICDEIHALTGPSKEAFLKPIEDSPPKTIWLLATTEPEKLTDTIRGRCLMLKLTPIEPEDMTKRIYTISKREGLDLSTIKDGDKIVESIVNTSRGQMRDAIKLLETVLFSYRSNKKISADDLVSEFIRSADGELEKLSAQLLLAAITSDVRGVIRIVKTADDGMGLLQKTRWLVDYNLGAAVKMAKWQSAGAKAFALLVKDKGISPNLNQLITFQQMLVDTEFRMYSNIDKNVLLMSAIGSYIVNNAQKKNA